MNTTSFERKLAMLRTALGALQDGCSMSEEDRLESYGTEGLNLYADMALQIVTDIEIQITEECYPKR